MIGPRPLFLTISIILSPLAGSLADQLPEPLPDPLTDTMASATDDPAPEVSAGNIIPVENFAQTAQIWGPSVSPDGKHLAYFRQGEDDDFLMVAAIDGINMEIVEQIASGEDMEFNWVLWANPERLLVSYTHHDRIGRAGKTKWPMRRLMSMNVDGSDAIVLLGDVRRIKWFRFDFDDVIHLLPNDPEHILLGFSDEGDRQSNVYKANIYTGERELILEPEKGHFVSDWYADWDGNVRYGYGRDKKRKRLMLIRRPNGDWEPLHKHELFEDGRFRLLGFSEDERFVYVLSSHITGRDAVFKFDLEEGELAGRVFQHDEVDINGILISRARKKVVAVSYTLDQRELHFLDDDYAAFRERLNNSLPDTVNYVVSINDDETFAVVSSRSPRDPGRYYLYDMRPGHELLAQFAEIRPKIDPAKMAPVTRVTYEARDSLQIPAYLTVPLDGGDEPKPAIIMPHGGPWVRDTLSFDYWAQFLANRGYVVLQPNFRGSSGYGDRYEALGYGGWGRAMQDDVTDGARWLIKEGLADPDRICVVGGSYGGYAALMGVIKDPKVFKCAAAWAPATDIKRLLKDWRAYDVDDWDYRRVAGALTKKELERISPIKRYEEINRPVLIFHGDDDTRVDVKHSQDFAKKMERKDKDIVYVELEGETHFLEEEANRILWLKALEGFLAEHIGPKEAPAEPAFEAAVEAAE